MVNMRALTPGHVILCPTRVVKSFYELTELETLEIFTCAREIAKKFEDYFKVKSFSFILQDGEAAGQSAPHIHLHIIPRDESRS
jgi:bis(5'-adenosyl)-triphosphatase